MKKIDRTQEIKNRQKQFENNLKTLGYYDGKPVMIIVGVNGLRVELSEPNEREQIKLPNLKPVHCRCSLIPNKDKRKNDDDGSDMRGWKRMR